MKKFNVANVQLIDNYLLLSLRPCKRRDVLQFYPGQYATISFMINGRPSPMRCFSMVSSPSKAEVQFAMRVQGNFTQAIAQLAVGTEVRLQGPYGDFVIDPEQDADIVLIAGGIGITPFMSMLRYAAETSLQSKITLLYACRSQQDIPFYDEILLLQDQNPHFSVVFFINQNDPVSPMRGQVVTGRIGETHLRGATNNQTYFICGPDGFRDNIEQILANQQVDASRVLTESFTQAGKNSGLFGYSIPKLTYVLSGFALLGLIAFIATLDLSRNLPHTTVSTTPPAAATSATVPTTPTANTTTVSPVSGTNTTNTTPVPTSTGRYQPPVSSMS